MMKKGLLLPLLPLVLFACGAVQATQLYCTREKVVFRMLDLEGKGIPSSENDVENCRRVKGTPVPEAWVREPAKVPNVAMSPVKGK